MYKYLVNEKNISLADFLKTSVLLLVCVGFAPIFASAQKSNTFETSLTSSSPNGKIAFVRNGQIFTMNADGSDATALTSGVDRTPQWSSDGTKIAFMRTVASTPDIFTMNADGSNQIRKTNMGDTRINNFGWSPDETKFAVSAWLGIYYINTDGTNPVIITQSQNYNDLPKFSPDGSKIIYLCSRTYDGQPSGLNDDVCIVNADGTNEINITHHPAADHSAVFSPDGTKVAFVTNRSFNGPGEVYIMNSDGSGLTNLTNSPDVNDNSPTWSPDGTKIAFATNRDGAGNSEIYVMNADGSNPTRLTDFAGTDTAPSWQRVASNASVGGRIATAGGRGLGNVQVVMTGDNGTLRTALSNAFGYFTFENVPTGVPYTFSISSKRYIFNQDSQVRIIIAETQNVNFTAND